MNVFVLVFGIIYPIVALAVLCVGAFGIGANMSETKDRAIKRAKNFWTYSYSEHTTAYTVAAVIRASLLALISAATWPVAVPVYLSYKKGQFINDALLSREKITAKYSALALDSGSTSTIGYKREYEYAAD